MDVIDEFKKIYGEYAYPLYKITMAVERISIRSCNLYREVENSNYADLIRLLNDIIRSLNSLVFSIYKGDIISADIELKNLNKIYSNLKKIYIDDKYPPKASYTYAQFLNRVKLDIDFLNYLVNTLKQS